jgi:hypothetical protein
MAWYRVYRVWHSEIRQVEVVQRCRCGWKRHGRLLPHTSYEIRSIACCTTCSSPTSFCTTSRIRFGLHLLLQLGTQPRNLAALLQSLDAVQVRLQNNPGRGVTSWNDDGCCRQTCTSDCQASELSSAFDLHLVCNRLCLGSWCAHRTYLPMNFLWKSDRSKSLTNSLLPFCSVPRA